MSNEPRRNVYVGHRYVPKIMGEWDQEKDYEGLSIVTYQGTSYTSKKRVPVGIDISDEEYWTVTGNYNVQVEQYRKEVKDLKEETEKNIADVNENMDNLQTDLNENKEKVTSIDYKLENYGERNLLDTSVRYERTRINGSTGQEHSALQYTTSGYNKVLPNKTHILYEIYGRNITNVGIIFYNDQGGFLEGQALYFEGSYEQIEFTVPSNATQVRITARTDRYFNDGRLEDFKLQLGTEKKPDLETKIETLKHRFITFQNSDDAITKLINTGLTYAKMTDLEYGNDYTPYSYRVQKNNRGNYELDCSSFAQVALQGITAENSRYYHDDNYADTFNYPLYNPNTSHGRFLANATAKWAYENGYTFEANEDFSNVKAGDMYFHYNASSQDINFWRVIGHNGFIVDIKGTNKNRPHFDVLECGGDSQGIRPENNPVGINRYSYDEFVRVKRTYLFARFPMQHISNQTRDITIDHFSNLRDLATSVPLQENKVYTAFVKLSNRNGNYPILSINGQNLVSGFNQNYSGKDEVLFRLVFYIPSSVLTGDNDFIQLLLGSDSSDVNIDFKAIYEGFVTSPNDYIQQNDDEVE